MNMTDEEKEIQRLQTEVAEWKYAAKLHLAARDKAVTAERERCEKIAKDFVERTNADIAHAILAAIRKGEPVDTGVKPSELAARS